MKQPKILSIDTVLVQCEGNIVSDMDGEKVMLSVQKGKYFNLGQVGGDIWSAISTPRSVKEIIESLQQIYEIDADICEQDVIPFLQHLLKEDLIRVADAE
ncbi:lasso peptide biosynthesis PqqD family chaperone [Paenibacillus rhizophilus]|uniref:Lasso peptide biosynthesis PqqD family chaperone n=2 Tax=Paenibacillus TaxID=44249 RepID=A0A3N9P4J3_9BACL|nr:lasso peptide biosynthesis PqqD family chaperone [Paenibacillus rhizophilus]